MGHHTGLDGERKRFRHHSKAIAYGLRGVARRRGMVQNCISIQGRRDEMLELLFVFQDVEDPRRGNAKRHDLPETL